MLLLYQLFTVCLTIHLVSSRIHKVRIEEDSREKIDLSTFGFLRHSYLSIDLTRFSTNPPLSEKTSFQYGFVLDKTVSTGISPNLESSAEKCALDTNINDLKKNKTDGVSKVMFVIDFPNKIVHINHRSDQLLHLLVTNLTGDEFLKARNHLEAYNQRHPEKPYSIRGPIKLPPVEVNGQNDNLQADDSKSISRRAALSEGLMSSPFNGTEDEAVTDEAVTVQDFTLEDEYVQQDDTEDTEAEDTAIYDQPPDFKILNNSFPLKMESDKVIGLHFLVIIEDSEEEGLYNLFFHNCYAQSSAAAHSTVSFTMQITEYNDGNYLSAGRIPLPFMLLVLSAIYFLLGCFWLYVLRTSLEGVFRIHYLMLTLVWVKSLSVLFHSINYYFIQRQGHHEETFAILYYITHLMRGALLFLTIFLIGAGWTFIKCILSDRDKKIFCFVIPLQILANVAQIIIEETEEGLALYTTWTEIFILVDLLCCGAILLPVVWSIRHLQDASQSDGKAAINLEKLKIFRHFYIMIVCYIYFTRIIVYLLKITVPFQYEWLYELFRELATLVFFFVTGYEFRPSFTNPYLQLSTEDDDELEMDEVLTRVGAYDGLKHVNVKVTDDSTTIPVRRESSHEYD